MHSDLSYLNLTYSYAYWAITFCTIESPGHLCGSLGLATGVHHKAINSSKQLNH